MEEKEYKISLLGKYVKFPISGRKNHIGRVSSIKTAVRKFKYTWNGMIQEDMANKEYRHHPTQKPLQTNE